MACSLTMYEDGITTIDIWRSIPTYVIVPRCPCLQKNIRSLSFLSNQKISASKVNNICILWEVWLQRIKDSFPHQSVIIYFPQRSFLFPFMKEKPSSHLVDLINESHLHICFIIRCKGIHRETIFPWPQNTNWIKITSKRWRNHAAFKGISKFYFLLQTNCQQK